MDVGLAVELHAGLQPGPAVQSRVLLAMANSEVVTCSRMADRM